MLREKLRELAALEPTTLPFLSVYVDLTPELEGSHQSVGGPAAEAPVRSWRREPPEHQQRRPGIGVIDHLLHQRGLLLPPRGTERDSFEADAARIRAYLHEGRFDPAAHGVAIFACAGEGIWEVVELPVPVPTRLLVDRGPVIYPLARVEDTYDRYALCLANSQTARVYVVALGRATHEETIKGPSINYKMTGGWCQRRIQERIKNAVAHHFRQVAQRLEEIVFSEEIPRIVLSGDEIAQTEFRRHLSPRALERVVEMNRLDTKLPEHEAISRSLAAILEAEAEEGRDRARQALDAVLADGLGAAGPEAVAIALRRSAVDTLLLDPSFDGTGWRGALEPELAARPAGGDEGAAARETFTSLAVQTGAEVEFVEGSEELARMGGVAALLRWRPEDLPNRVAPAAEQAR